MDGVNPNGGMREMMLRRFDKDGDGKLSAEEKAEAKEQMKKRLDTNGDGKISAEEKQAAREFMKKKEGSERRPGRPGGPPPPPPGSQGHNQGAKSKIDIKG